jgi:hypothetical protein
VNLKLPIGKIRAAMMAALLLALVLFQSASAEPAPLPAPIPDARMAAADRNRIAWQGSDWFLHGVNLPWYQWACDFGCGASGGVSDATVNQTLDERFAALRASGVKVVRWWVFMADAHQITRDPSSTPTGLNVDVFADMDAALALADRHDLYYSFTLFSAPSHLPPSWLSDPGHRLKLAQALAPLFARYGDTPRILTWEVFNEPEWDIWTNKAPREGTREVVRLVAEAVHASSHAYVTVGSAMLDGLPMWKHLGLDYYQAHWYDYMSGGNWCARCTDYATVQRRYDLDRPLVIGEYYAGPEVDTAQRLADWRAKGYAGAYAWSFLSDRTKDRMEVSLPALQAFARQHADTQIRQLDAISTEATR